MQIKQTEDITFVPMIQALWKEHYPAQKDSMRDALKATGWDLSEPVTIRFVEDQNTAILYHGADACGIITLDYSEPCLKITYVQA